MTGSAPREWDADAYHRLAEHQRAWGRAVLARLPLGGDETVLDAGCGTGRVTELLLARLPRGRVVAVDASRAMLRAARAHLLPRWRGRVDFLFADLAALRLAAPVDAVFSNAVFHHVPDHPALFPALHAALRPGGRLVAQCGGGPNLVALRAHVAAVAAGDARLAALRGWPGPWEFADAPTTRARLSAAGFVPLGVSVTAAPVTLASPEVLAAHLRAVTLRSHLAVIGDAAARDALVAGVVARCMDDEPPLTLDHWRLDIDALRP